MSLPSSEGMGLAVIRSTTVRLRARLVLVWMRSCEAPIGRAWHKRSVDAILVS